MVGMKEFSFASLSIRLLVGRYYCCYMMVWRLCAGISFSIHSHENFDYNIYVHALFFVLYVDN